MSALGVCSWSLRPHSPRDLAEKVRSCGVFQAQLHLDPLRTGAWKTDETVAALRSVGAQIVSGMMGMKGEDYTTLETIKATGGVRPDATWNDNLAAAEGNAAIAAELGLRLVTFHAGFLPHDGADAERAAMIKRLRMLAEVFAARGVRVALETGQEDAATLEGVLGELNVALPSAAAVGVNFDPANMILYGMGDPVAALRRLARHVRQLHLKDARKATTPGSWGEEVPVGAGEVDWQGFVATSRRAGLLGRGGVGLMIEREAGDDRERDIVKARERLAPLIAR